MKGAKKSPPGKEAMEKTLEVDLSTLKGKRVHFISDLHFGHLNIIRYCNRPFRDLEHMEEQMIIKWNEAVEKGDIVFYGGDMAYGKRSKPLEEYLKQLNGKIYYVKGNHDKRKGSPITMYTYIEFSYGDLKFRLVHNPDEWKHYKGWVIHGHHHNNHPVEYPMVSKENRTINVSCELLNYRPMPLQDILDTIWDDKRPTFTLKRGEPHCVLCGSKLNVINLEGFELDHLRCPECMVPTRSIHKGCGGEAVRANDDSGWVCQKCKENIASPFLIDHRPSHEPSPEDDERHKKALEKECPHCKKTQMIEDTGHIPYRCEKCGVSYVLLGAWIEEGKKPVMLICSERDWPGRFTIDPKNLKGKGTLVCYNEEMAGFLKSRLPEHRIVCGSSYYFKVQLDTSGPEICYTLKCEVPPNGEEYEPVTTHCGKCGKLLTAARMDKEDRKSNKEVIRIYCHKCGKQFSSDLKPELDLYLHRDCGGRMYLVRPRDEYLCQICRKRVKK